MAEKTLDPRMREDDTHADCRNIGTGPWIPACAGTIPFGRLRVTKRDCRIAPWAQRNDKKFSWFFYLVHRFMDFCVAAVGSEVGGDGVDFIGQLCFYFVDLGGQFLIHTVDLLV